MAAGDAGPMIPAHVAFSAGSHADLVASIGRTPIVHLRRLARHRHRAVGQAGRPPHRLAEGPGRARHAGDALASGSLQPGQTILEPSSGNTGISLAMLGARLGHPVRIVMPDNTTPERTQLLQLYGAGIVYSPGAEGSNGAIRLAQELADADPNLFMPYQYGNEANPRPRAGHRSGDPGRGAGARCLLAGLAEPAGR